MPAEPDPAMSLQLPPFWPSKPQVVSRSSPRSVVVLSVWGVNRHGRVFTTQPQAVSFGVGGKFVDAKKDEFCWGHEGNCVGVLHRVIIIKQPFPLWISLESIPQRSYVNP